MVISLGEALREVRTTRTELSARGLSLAAGLSDSYVGKVESGKLEPSFGSFARIAKVLNLTPMEVRVLMEIATDDKEDGNQ